MIDFRLIRLDDTDWNRNRKNDGTNIIFHIPAFPIQLPIQDFEPYSEPARSHTAPSTIT